MRAQATAGTVLATLALFVLLILIQMTAPSPSSSHSNSVARLESHENDLLRGQADGKEIPVDSGAGVQSTTTDPDLSSSLIRDDARSDQSDPRRLMHTFYAPIEGKKQTGMTDRDDQVLLNAWKREWSRSGWETRVISLDTARQHPDFDKVNSIMDGLPFLEYDRYCFFRWLAMAVVGGGWHSDYDTFPLHAPPSKSLPNGGRLTVHEHSKNGGVPDLVSGSAQEWYRMSVILMQDAVQHKNESHWSDMFAMHSVYVAGRGTVYTMEKNVVPGQVLLKGGLVDGTMIVDDRICRRTADKYAAHFSHYAIENGDVQEGSGPQDRAVVATEWLRKWRKACLPATSQGIVQG